MDISESARNLSAHKILYNFIFDDRISRNIISFINTALTMNQLKAAALKKEHHAIIL